MGSRRGGDAHDCMRAVGSRDVLPRTHSRAIEWAVTAAGLGAFGHIIGGAPVSPVVILPALVPLFILARVCARRERGAAAIAVLLVAGQAWVHTLASLTGHHASTKTSSMLAGHVIGTAVAVVVLRRREAMAWARARRAALVRYIARLLRLLEPVAPAAPARVLVSARREPLRALGGAIGSSVVRRGPPSVAVS